MRKALATVFNVNFKFVIKMKSFFWPKNCIWIKNLLVSYRYCASNSGETRIWVFLIHALFLDLHVKLDKDLWKTGDAVSSEIDSLMLIYIYIYIYNHQVMLTAQISLILYSNYIQCQHRADINSCWSANTGMSVFKSPEKNVTCLLYTSFVLMAWEMGGK